MGLILLYNPYEPFRGPVGPGYRMSLVLADQLNKTPASSSYKYFD